jgi:segregation and condensation protein A
MTDYRVQFEVFEGPLDLLLYLIKKEEVDIYEVNLTRLATQFLEYVEVMRMLDLEIAGEFLVMASTLMYIKSRELLPVDQQVTAEGEDDAEDPRWELIRQLVEYKKFKDAAAQLQTLEARQENVFPRLPCKPSFETAPVSKSPQVGLFDLINAVNAILRRVNLREDLRDIFEDKWTVSEKIEYLRQLLAARGRLRFSELFAGATSRSEIVCTFLALLELMRLRHLVALQHAAFGEIEIEAAPLADPETNPGEAYAAALASENLQAALTPSPPATAPTSDDATIKGASTIQNPADDDPLVS